MKKCKKCGGSLKKGKCMKCMGKSNTTSLTEASLLKALHTLEKGAIPKEMKDSNGGFATEGDDDELQVSASENAEPKHVKKSKTKKAESSEESDEESSAEESSMGKGGDESSDEEHSPAETSSPELSEDDAEESMEMSRKAKKAKKSAKPAKVTKSIKKAMTDDENVGEFVDASSFLESLVDAVSDSNVEVNKSLDKLAGRFFKSHERQQTFNGQLAKAIVLQGNLTVEIAKGLRRLRKSLENIPDLAQGRTKLNKSDVVEREFQDTSSADQLDVGEYRTIMDKLIDLAQKGTVPAAVVSDFELHKSLEVVPEDIRPLITGLH